MTTSRPQLIMLLNGLSITAFYSRSELVEFLRTQAPMADLDTIEQAIRFAEECDVISTMGGGSQFVRRKVVSEIIARDFEAWASRGVTEVDPRYLAELVRKLPEMDHRIKQLETQVDNLKAAADAVVGAVHWLQLVPQRVPRPVFDALIARAKAVLGPSASESAIYTQMVLEAARLIQDALHQEGPKAPGTETRPK